jgi:hypothetical protein
MAPSAGQRILEEPRRHVSVDSRPEVRRLRGSSGRVVAETAIPPYVATTGDRGADASSFSGAAASEP